MPRLATALLRRARARDANLARLLPGVRVLEDASSELRWLREHVVTVETDVRKQSGRLRRLCILRGRGVPLQYLLGTTFFGPLEFRCRPGVLIPRWETAESAIELARRLAPKLDDVSEPRVLDLCTGSGCLGLLLAHELIHRDKCCEKSVRLRGVDVSRAAIRLAQENAGLVFQTEDVRQKIDAVHGDVLASLGPDKSVPRWAKDGLSAPEWHVVVANPPYISPESLYSGSTSSSVRRYEPRLALVPPSGEAIREDKGDVFYKPILDLAACVHARVVMLEVADMAQAKRVSRTALNKLNGSAAQWATVEIWRDEPTGLTSTESVQSQDGRSHVVSCHGQGQGRTVVCWRY